MKYAHQFSIELWSDHFKLLRSWRYTVGMAGKSTGSEEERTFTAKGQATRERIVAAAAQLIFEGGVAGTSWEDVETAAGVNSSQLYHYFGDKQRLVRAVIAYQTTTLLANQQPFLGSLDSLEALRAWRDLLVDGQRQTQSKGGCPLGSLTGELFEAHPECREDLKLGFDVWEAFDPGRAPSNAPPRRTSTQRRSRPARYCTLSRASRRPVALKAPPQPRPARIGTRYRD